YDIGDANGFLRFFRPILLNAPDITSVAFSDENGNELLLYRDQDGAWLERATNPEKKPGLARLISWTHDGKRIGERTFSVDYDARTRPWFKLAASIDENERKVLWTEPFVFRSTGDPGISAVVTWAAKGRRHHLATDLRFIELSKFTSALSAGKNGFAAIINDSGHVIGLPKDERFSDSQGIKSYVLKSVDEIGAPILAEGYRQWKSLRPQNDRLFNFNINGTEWLGVFTKKQLGEQVWWVGTFAPEADFLPSLSSHAPLFSALIILVLIFAWFIAHFVAGKFAKPLEELESQVSSYTSELELREAEALESVKQLEANAKTRMDFLARISHEIRTPMNVITGFSYLGAQTTSSEKKSEYLEKISGAAVRVAAIVEDLLNVSRMEIGKLRIEHQPFNLNDTLSYVEKIVSFKAEEKNLKLEVHRVPSLLNRVSGDALRLSQVIVNLVSNAIKFTDEGSVTVYTNVIDFNEDEGTCRLQFVVADTGVGIPESDFDKVFKPFSQFGSVKNQYAGVGLGLSICRQLVEMMNGTISFESKVGVGSRFMFEIPLRVLDEEITLHNESKIQLSGLRVLVVDDHEANLQVAGSVLRSVDCFAEFARDGKEAVEILEKRPLDFDIVLMDIQMPNLNGIDATREIRDRLQLEHIVIIALTAYVSQEDRVRCFNAGMDDFLAKPIIPETFLGAIQRWTELFQLTQDSPNRNDSLRPVDPLSS
ncbi:MAG TPA: ATP-binding protein, partial [Bdellovibrionales bacterium]|nr:ATP-binding protein [Bdellovibrionales bacterium]